jgi:predicted dehydrogenase/threonine dehydrogenase-like Zn-dependent dehydrogenase
VVKNLIAEPIPLGYSLVGTIIATGSGVSGIDVGDRVACAGLGHANHAEIVHVPRNLAARVPDNVSDEQAAYATLGAIAMHGVRQADQQLGSTVLVVGLGLVGQLTVQLCAAAGLRVIGTDLDARKLDIAKRNGAKAAAGPDDPALKALVSELSGGLGVDAVLLTAGARDSGAVFDLAAGLCRDRARVVVVGDVKMDLSRRTYFEKELEILQSRSYGPGRYDPNYEQKGHDYPVGYVRWTEGRNLGNFLDLIADGRLDPSRLTTHRYPIDRAAEAYKHVTGENRDLSIGVLLTYDAERPVDVQAAPRVVKSAVSGRIGLGIIGAGQFAKGLLLPAMMETGAFEVIGVASARGVSAQATADRYAARFASTEGERVLDDPAVRAVIVATRHDSHARYVLAALKRDKHVFVEKPLCIDADDLTRIETAARSSKGTLAVGYNRRFAPMALRLLDHFAGRREPLAMLYRINAGRIPLKYELAWVHDPRIGGGRIIGEACHFIDFMQAVVNARPIAVEAAGVHLHRVDLARDDVASFTVSFDDGSIGTVHYWANGDASYPKERFEVFGQERVAVLDNFRTLDLVSNNKTKRHRAFNVDKGFAAEATAFVEACRTGRPSIPLQSLIDTSSVTFAVAHALQISPDLQSIPVSQAEAVQE